MSTMERPAAGWAVVTLTSRNFFGLKRRREVVVANDGLSEGIKEQSRKYRDMKFRPAVEEDIE